MSSTSVFCLHHLPC